MGVRFRTPVLWKDDDRLAAAAGIIPAAAIVIIGVAAQTIVATATEQNQQNDDPAHIPTTEAVVIHNLYLQNNLADDPLIPRYSPGRILCKGGTARKFFVKRG